MTKRVKKSFREFNEERERRIKNVDTRKRSSYKQRLEMAIDNEDWDTLDEIESSNYNR